MKTAKYSMVSLIEKQKRGAKLTEDEIEYIISGYTDGSVPDYQMSAYLMAVCFTGLSDDLAAYMTKCMAESGRMLDMSAVGGVVVDKHSTGGVGDKTTLAVVPIVAACGGKVAKMSGRGLGFTGGTIDKLESIPGFKTEISTDEFVELVRKNGAAIVSQMSDLAPADKKIYALRDVTGTVDCLPLIASSVMSKKIASGAAAVVLDVKYGSGAFMKQKADAEKLAALMTRIGDKNNLKTKTVISSMDQPLGAAVGNDLEVAEAVRTLKGEGPKDFHDLCIELAASMLELTLGQPYNSCAKAAEDSIRSGAALDKLIQIVSAQGGDARYIADIEQFNKARYIFEVTAEKSGVIKTMDTERIGEVSCMLGAGRKKLGDKIDFAAGLMVYRKLGDKVTAGDVIARLHTNDPDVVEIATEKYRGSIVIE